MATPKLASHNQNKSDRRSFVRGVLTGGFGGLFGAVMYDGWRAGWSGLPSLVNKREMDTTEFLSVAIDYFRGYKEQPTKRLVMVGPNDEKGKQWLSDWAGFIVPDTDLSQFKYRRAGFAHYPWGDRKVVVGIYERENATEADGPVEEKEGPILLCLTAVSDGGPVVRENSGFSRSVGFDTIETTSRDDRTRIAIAVVGSTSNITTLSEARQQAVADI